MIDFDNGMIVRFKKTKSNGEYSNLIGIITSVDWGDNTVRINQESTWFPMDMITLVEFFGDENDFETHYLESIGNSRSRYSDPNDRPVRLMGAHASRTNPNTGCGSGHQIYF